MPLLKRKRVLAAKVETTIGTAESLTGSEGSFNAYDVIIQPQIEVTPREGQGGFGRLSGVPGQRKGTASFKVDLAYDGTTVPTLASVLFPGCGWVQSTGLFTPRSEAPGSNVKTLTIGCYIDGVFKSIAGAVGTCKIVCPAGRMITVEFEFQGVWQAPTDTAIIAPTYPTASPWRFASATVTYNSVAAKVENVTFDMGNEITFREDATTASGLHSAIIVDRMPKITCNPEAVTVATQDVYGLWIAPTEASFVVVLDGPTNSDITLTAPKAQIMNAQEGDRGKIVTNEIELICNKNGATHDQEFSIDFNAAS